MDEKLMVRMIVLANLLIYFIFLIIDIVTEGIGNNYSSYLKYVTILLCFLLSLFIKNNGYDKKDTFLLQIALFFTVIADFFLMILNWHRPGIVMFILVQIAYIMRHNRGWKSSNRISYKIIFIYLIILFFSIKFRPTYITPGLYLISIIYASLLTISLIIAIDTIKKKYYPREGAIIIALGMFLFFMCDLNVALFNIIGDHNTGIFYGIPFGFLIWLFYFPSQLLLTLSGYNFQYLKGIFKK